MLVLQLSSGLPDLKRHTHTRAAAQNQVAHFPSEDGWTLSPRECFSYANGLSHVASRFVLLRADSFAEKKGRLSEIGAESHFKTKYLQREEPIKGRHTIFSLTTYLENQVRFVFFFSHSHFPPLCFAFAFSAFRFFLLLLHKPLKIEVRLLFIGQK